MSTELEQIIIAERDKMGDDNMVIFDRERLDAAILHIVLELGPSLVDISAEEFEKRLKANFVTIANTLFDMLPELELRHVGALAQILCVTLVKAVPLLQREYLENIVASGNA